jgi:polyisoprenoid-binding protein YceI
MSSDQPSRRRPILAWALVAIALVAIAFGAFAFWFLDDDSPDEVSIGGAAAQVDDGAAEATTATTVATPATTTDTPATPAPTTASTGGDDGADESPEPAGIDGTWSVDTSIGEFSYEDSTGTFVGFRIAEELSGIGSTEAVGRTPVVSGTLVADGTTITEVDIDADMTAITTNDGRRDDNVQRALDTGEFPTATFALTEPIELGAGALDGEAVAVDAVGDLTIHGVTESVVFPLEAQLVGDTIVVVGSLDIVFADYDVEVPSAPIVVSVDDNGPIELQLFFTR